MAVNGWPTQRPGWNPRMSISISNTKGLLNAPGENNCFLNSAVQVLWHLDVFRRSFRMMSGHACMGNSCIFCALKVIFTQFQFSDSTALPSDSLRKALAKTFADQQRFQLGLMDDAAECFEKMLLRIHFHLAHPQSEDSCSAQHCIPHRKFGMAITEQVLCECGAASEPFSFTQMVHYVSTSTLVSHLQQAKTPCNFGSILRLASSDGSELKTCPGNCGRQNVHVRRSLTSSPEVVSVGLIWDSDHPSLNHINDVLRAIGTSLSLAQLFHSVPDPRRADACPLQLVGVVCYYGKHYSTFFFHSKTKTWLSFDDATVLELDQHWESVVGKCSQGHYQPLLLLFADPDSVPVSTETAHQNTFMLDTGAALASAEHNVCHNRQRSFERLSDGSGTIGGRGATQTQFHLAPQMPQASTKNARRATTPNPMKMADRSLSVSRRAVTPNPEWAMTHSDDEEDHKQPGHYRQSSYLHAFDTGHRRTSAPHYNSPITRGDTYAGTNNSGLMSRSHCSADSEAVAIDLSGPIPKAAEYHRYHNEIQRPNANYPYAGAAFTQQHPQRVRTHSLGQDLDHDCPPQLQRSVDAEEAPRGRYGCSMVQQDEDDYGTYISRKAVQSILKHQGIQRTAAPIKDLNVEIPDNSSLNSHQESGYRSGNSASSTASSLESPNDATVRVPVCAPQRLTHIPEGITSSYITERNKGKPIVCASKPAVPLKPGLNQAAMKPAKNDAESIEKLYMESESLMELANEKQEQGDVSTALLHCNKAISVLQQAQNVPNACQEGLVRIRMKQNACVLRSRRLHKQLTGTQRQMSNQSNVSSDVGIESDHISVSSTDTDSNSQQKMYTKQDSGYGGYGTDGTDCQYNVRRAAQAYKTRASSNGFAGITRSITDSQIAKRQRQDSVDRLSQDVDVVDGNNSQSNSIEHFATLPRKGKAKAKPSASKEAEVYQAYLQRQRSCDDTVIGHAKQGLEHARQWSKDDIRQMLVKDYYERCPKEQESFPAPPPPHEEAVRAINRSNSNLSYEDMIQRQMQSMALKEGRASNGQVRVLPQTAYQPHSSEYYVGLRNEPLRKSSSNTSLTAHVEALKLVGSSTEVALAPNDPCPPPFTTAANDEPVTGSSSSAPNSQPANMDEDLPPPPTDLLSPPPPSLIFDDDDLPPPPYPGLPDAPLLQPPNGVEAITVSPVWTSMPCRCSQRNSNQKVCSKPCSKCKVSRQGSNSSTSSWGSSSSPLKPRVPPKLKTFQQLDSGISSGYCSHAPDSPTSAPRSRSKSLKHHKHRQRSRTCSPKSARIPETPEPKPALSKKKKKGRKQRKSVTFSENIALISTPEDKPPEIDYVKYVMENFPNRKADRSNSFSSTSTNADCDTISVTRSDGESSRSSTDLSNSTKSSGQGQGYDSDLEVNSCSEGEDTDIEEPTSDIVNKMRCALCRKKWVDRQLQYCEACGAYMSQFQPLKT